jgi:hypothetical protein
LATRSTDEIVDLLDRAAARWRPGDGRDRQARAAAEQRLAHLLPLDPDMMRHGLDLIFSAIDRGALEALIARDCARFDEGREHADGPAATAGRRSGTPLTPGSSRRLGDGRRVRLLGPKLIVHALAGNVPGLAIPVIAASLLARSVVLVRDSRRQPVLTEAFVATLAALDPLIATTVVPVPAGLAIEALAVRARAHGARVEVSGSDATVERLAAIYYEASDRERVSRSQPSNVDDIDVVERGTRTSAVVATAGSHPESWAEAIAHDVVMYEGLGCLTPHTLIVETDDAVGDNVRASAREADGDTERALEYEHACKREWIDALGAALDRFGVRWPRVPQGLMLERERRAFLERTELARALATNTLSAIGRNESWCILHGDETTGAAVGLGPGLRCINVVGSRSRAHTFELLRRSTAPLAGVGLTLDGDERPFAELERALVDATGATLVCSAGQMQAPPLCWRQDGRARLGDLLAWREDAGPHARTTDAEE